MNIIRNIIRHRYLTVLTFVLLISFISSGVDRLQFIADLRVFFSEDNPQLQNLEKFERAFTKMGSVVFIFNPDSEDIFTRETLTAIRDLTRSAWELPHSSSVKSLTNFSYTRADGDELLVENLVPDPALLSDDDLKRIKNFALHEPMLLHSLISSRGHVATVVINITASEGSFDNPEELAVKSQELADRISSKYQDIEIYISGSEIFNYAFTQVSRNDMKTLYPLMFLIMVIMMFLLLRSVAAVTITLIIIIASALTAMGLAGFLDICLTTASAIAPIIILTVAVADSVHLLVSVLYYLRQGMEKNDAILEALRVNFQPVFLTSLTTAIGFLSMLTSDSPPFRDLGLIVALGVVVAFVYSVCLLPALLAIFPMKISSNLSGKTHRFRFNFDTLSTFVIARQKTLLFGMTLLLLVLSLGLPRLELYDNFVEYFDERYEVRRVTDFLEENVSGLSSIKYLMDSGEEGGINDPEFLGKIEAFSNWYLSQPEVVKVASILHTIKRLNKNMHGDDPAYYCIPQDRELVAQYLLLYEMSLPFGHDLQDSMTTDRSALSLAVHTSRISTLAFRQLEERAARWLAENSPGLQPPATGMVSMFAHISERNIKGMLKSTVLALALISVVLIVAVRSLKFGVFSLIPNIIPAIMTFGLWGLMVGNVNMAVSYIAAMSLGIVVDDTVHFLSKYLRARREMGLSPEAAIQYTFQTVGMALLTTSIILSAGFTVLFFSGFAVNAVMGILMAIAICFALIADFFFLPVLLLRIDKQNIS